MKNIPLLLFLIVFFYLLFEAKFPTESSSSSPVAETESDFTQGLPPDYFPDDLNRFSNKGKLQADLQYRKQKLETHFQDELRNSQGPKSRTELIEKHQQARLDFEKGSQEILQSYEELYEDSSSRDKGLR